MRDQKRKQVVVDTSATTNTIPYDQAVAEGKAIIENAERGQWRLGELAHSVEKQYGESKLAKFAEAIGVAPCTLARYRDVYRKWKDFCAPGRKSISDIPYSVLRELATLDDHVREQIIRDHPDITKREAREEVRKHKGNAKEKQQQEQENEWLRDNRRWFNDLVALGHQASRMAGVVDECTPEQLDNLLQAINPGSLMHVRGGGRMLIDLAARLEALLAEQEAAEPAEVSEPVEASAPIERAHPEATAQAAVA
jgi:hypothetical protein